MSYLHSFFAVHVLECQSLNGRKSHFERAARAGETVQTESRTTYGSTGRRGKVRGKVTVRAVEVTNFVTVL